jgi:hypothetical protein
MTIAITGSLEDREHLQVGGDGLGDAPLLAADSRVCAGGVDESKQRPFELFRLLRQAQGLPVAFWMGPTVVALQVFLHGPALLVSQEGEVDSVDSGNPPYQGQVVAEEPVAVEFHIFVGNHADVFKYVGPVLVPGQFDPLPGGHAGLVFSAELGADAIDIIVDIQVLGARQALEFA